MLDPSGAYAGYMGGTGAFTCLNTRDPLLQTYSSQPSHLGRFRGLGWDRKFGAWRVRIFFNQKQHHVGRFRDPLTAARAYNKVVTFLYGDKAILNLVPEDDAAMDTYDIPFAIREAKREADLQKSGTSSASTSAVSDSRTAGTTYKTINSSGDSTTSSSSSNISSASLSQLLATSSQQQLQDLMMQSPEADVLALSSCALLGSSLVEGGMLPLSCGLVDEGSLLLNGFAGHPHAVSTAPLLGLSTGLMQMQDMQVLDPQLLLPSATAPLQDAGMLAGMQFSTAPLSFPSADPMRSFDLGANFLQQQAQVSAAQYGMPSAYLGAFQQEPLPYVDATGQSSMWPLEMPWTNNLACNLPGANAASVMVGAPGPVTAGCAEPDMSVFPSLVPFQHQQSAQQLNACGRVMVGVPAGSFVASNGMVVMYAPAPPS